MIYIVGIVGLPCSYGGFETLVDCLLDYNPKRNGDITVFCDSSTLSSSNNYKGANLIKIPLKKIIK